MLEVGLILAAPVCAHLFYSGSVRSCFRMGRVFMLFFQEQGWGLSLFLETSGGFFFFLVVVDALAKRGVAQEKMCRAQPPSRSFFAGTETAIGLRSLYARQCRISRPHL